ncbi:MAG: hypothetical protein Q9187_006749 [Circinaria calcarea]
MATTRPRVPSAEFYNQRRNWSPNPFRMGFAITQNEYNVIYAALADEMKNAGLLGSAVNTENAQDDIADATNAIYNRNTNILAQPPIRWREKYWQGLAQRISRDENNQRRPAATVNPGQSTQSAEPRPLPQICLYAVAEDFEYGITTAAFEANPRLENLDLEKWKDVIENDCGLCTAEYKIMYDDGNMEIDRQRKWLAASAEIHQRGVDRFTFDITPSDIGIVGPDQRLSQSSVAADDEETEETIRYTELKRARIRTATSPRVTAPRSPSPLPDPDRNRRESKSVEIDIGHIVEVNDDESSDDEQVSGNGDEDEDEDEQEDEQVVEEERAEEDEDEELVEKYTFYKRNPAHTSIEKRINIPGLKIPLYQFQAFGTKIVQLSGVEDISPWGLSTHPKQQTQSVPLASYFPICCPCVQRNPSANLMLKFGPVLILVPPSLISNWVAEWQKTVDESCNRVGIRLRVGHRDNILVAKLSKDDASYLMTTPQTSQAECLRQSRWIILSSSQSFKNHVFKYLRSFVQKPLKGQGSRRKFEVYEDNIYWGRAFRDEFHQEKSLGTVSIKILEELQGQPYKWMLAGTPFEVSPKDLEGYITVLETQDWANDTILRECMVEKLPPHEHRDIDCGVDPKYAEALRILQDRLKRKFERRFAQLHSNWVNAGRPGGPDREHKPSSVGFFKSNRRARLFADIPALSEVVNQKRLELTGTEPNEMDAYSEDGSTWYEQYLDYIIGSSKKITQIGKILDKLGTDYLNRKEKILITFEFPVAVFIIYLWLKNIRKAKVAIIHNGLKFTARQALIHGFEDQKVDDDFTHDFRLDIIVSTTKLISAGYASEPSA